ncbi:MAG: hypothetical protein J3R72DRAFT_496368 [Linnemannia gamsii]|nr:MAG: hypothetical protein J3R72DRAFT_496368 [Linnemannia gamsii]
MSDIIHLIFQYPQQTNNPKPKRFLLSTIPSSSIVLEAVYDILHGHEEQLQDFFDWVPTVLHKHHVDLVAQLQHELDHNTGDCLITILPSTDKTIPATSCFPKER